MDLEEFEELVCCPIGRSRINLVFSSFDFDERMVLPGEAADFRSQGG